MEPDNREPPMRRLLVAIALAMAVLPWATAEAQLPSKHLVSGQVHPMLAQANPGGAWCFVGRGLSMFEASTDGSQAVISLPELFYFDGAAYYQLGGQGHLNFTSATDGHIKFRYTTEYPTIVTIPAFSNYSEVAGEAPNLTVVNFWINFTTGTDSSNCTLPITIKYEAE
jgi:hypothetical protein